MEVSNDSAMDTKSQSRRGGRTKRRGRGRGGAGGRPINRENRRPRGRGRGGGQHYYSLNDRVMALWASESKYYRATISSVHWDGTYGIVFDTENDREYSGQREEQLQPIKNYSYSDGQAVKALFVKDDRWYDAKIVNSTDNGYTIKFNHLDRSFSQRAEYLRPTLEVGTKVLALWFKDGKYLPATIVEPEDTDDQKNEQKNGGNYTVKFDSRQTAFPGQRPDNIRALETFEENEEVLALWGQDHLFYPAKVVQVKVGENNMPSYSIKFHGLDKEFSARAHNLKKLNS